MNELIFYDIHKKFKRLLKRCAVWYSYMWNSAPSVKSIVGNFYKHSSVSAAFLLIFHAVFLPNNLFYDIVLL